MIKDYSIKIENDESILCIYLDFNYEFADFNSKDNTQTMQKKIKKYIKDKKIDFKGTKVAIIVGGIVISTLLLNKPISQTYQYTPPSIMENIIVEQEEIKENIKDVVIDESETKDKIEEVIKNDEEIITQDELVNKPIKEETNSNLKQENKQETNTIEKEQIKHDNIVQEEIKQETNNIKKEENNVQAKEEFGEEKTYVTIYRKSGTIVTMELEEYVIGVVAAEMPASFHIEALKSQAIIARTYALKSIENNKVLTDDSSTQNYKDNSQLQKMWGDSYNTYYAKVKKAVENTEGVYITYNNEIIEAVYHSTSNGQTENAENVWGNKFSYLVSVESKYDSTNSSFIKEKYMTYEQLSDILQTTVSQETDFSISGYTDGNRVENIQVNNKIYTGVKFRSLLGLRSADFEIKKEEEGVTITTKGYGHGVGLSQYGANGMAKNGYTYDQILKHYYNGIKINNI